MCAGCLAIAEICHDHEYKVQPAVSKAVKASMAAIPLDNHHKGVILMLIGKSMLEWK
jgi:hypothetical protein